MNPIVLIGQKGISDNVIAELELALDHHELVKVKMGSADRDSKSVMVETLCQRTGAECISTIGGVSVFYRQNTAQPVITFP